MDYFSAYAVVLYSLCAIFLKLFCEQLKLVNIRLYALSIVIPFVAFYLYHIHYLYFVRFDYGYNMKVNVFTGKSQQMSVQKTILFFQVWSVHFFGCPGVLSTATIVVTFGNAL